jgi:hypothetical protein
VTAEPQRKGAWYALSAALLFGASTPFSKVLLGKLQPILLANTDPLVSLPLAAPFSAKCAYNECLNLGIQSRIGHLRSLRHLLIQLGIAILFKNAFKCSSLNLVLR